MRKKKIIGKMKSRNRKMEERKKKWKEEGKLFLMGRKEEEGREENE